MLKLIAGSFAIATVIAGAALVQPAHAETLYPWCAQYRRSAATNCGFVTQAQCMAAISGVGGMCYENPAYFAPQPMPKRRRAQQH